MEQLHLVELKKKNRKINAKNLTRALQGYTDGGKIKNTVHKLYNLMR